jgi:fructose-specific phosphotransferase system IIA component
MQNKMELIDTSLVELDIDLPSKRSVVEKLADLLENSSRINDREQYITDVFDREKIVSTCVGDMIVIPHARSAAVDVASLLYLRLKDPVDWNGEDEAKYVLGIAVPAENVDNLHLQILSAAAKKLLDDTIKNKLFTSTSREEISTLLLS